ncbi:MAG: DUF1569 domain-containing protein [Planctomycetota bacterium]
MPKPEFARDLHFPDLDALLDDAREIARQPDAPTRGNWTPAQTIWHVARFVQFSVEGYPFSVSPLFKILGRLMKKSMTTKRMKPGVNLPTKVAAAVVPDPETSMGDAIDLMEHWIGEARSRGFLPTNPMLGPMTRGQWVGLHCRHAEMHFGLIELDPAPASKDQAVGETPGATG